FWINEVLGTLLLLQSNPPRPKEALPFLMVAVALRPQSPGAHVNLDKALYELGYVDEAIAEDREAIRLMKDYAEAHYNLGVGLLEAKGQLDEAIAEFREAIRLKKDYAEAHF